ncbi:MAG: hypothetical protein OEZ06_26135 [Myxococcales bacterium]|nr:hypothetical protein [Myxococcales bacterium]
MACALACALLACDLLGGGSGGAGGAGGSGGGPPVPSWQPAFDASATGWLLSVWGPPDGDEVYAAGGPPEQGLIMRREGADGPWLEQELPADTPGLNWLHGLDADTLWAVGNGGTILRFDGTRWSREESTVDRDLWGIWGLSEDDLWAVGGNGREEGQATLLHYDGSAWRQEPLPEFERARVWALFKVWGVAADDVWIVGQRGAVLHYDGSAWSERLVGASDDLISLWGTSSDRIAMVGGRAVGIVVTWNGQDFEHHSLSPLPGLNGVWMDDAEVIHVAGTENTLASVDFDSGKYFEEDVLEPTRVDFHAVFGDRSGQLTAVGGNLRMTAGPYRGIAVTRPIEDAGGDAAGDGS